MDERSGHLIERIVLTAELPEATFGTQRALGDWLRERGVAVIAAVCEEIIPPTELLRLDRLDLDLGTLEHLDPDLPTDRARLEERLAARLREMLAEWRREGEYRARGWRRAAGNAASPAAENFRGEVFISELGELSEGGTSSEHSRAFATWLYFLEHGCLPWWARSLPPAAAWSELIGTALQENAGARSQVQSLWRRSEAVVQRLLHDTRNQVVFHALLEEEPAAAMAWETWEAARREPKMMAQIFADQPIGKSKWEACARRVIWPWLLTSGERKSTSSAAVEAAALLERTVTAFTTEYRSRTQVAAEALLLLLAAKTKHRTLQTALQALGTPSANKTKAQAVDEAPGRNHPATEKSGQFGKEADPYPIERKPATRDSQRTRNQPETSQSPTNPVTEKSGQFGKEAAPDPIEHEPTTRDPQRTNNQLETNQLPENTATEAATPGRAWYVDHAGVVLAHPFLEPLFTALGYWQDGAFADELAQQRAVFLTYYLATGEVIGYEENMALAKVLCGWPATGAPVVLTEPLTERECREADEVLRSVIEHWPAIGKASPEGLREGFFAREARLEARENDWLLTVERKAQDLLLGRLPWGISLVRGPWHDRFLKIAW